ncbi:3,4-dihydroxyphenylacetate 2,3-dioxygenase [Streptomyces sp. NPDC057474]|uniref:3,4-dihydroxyphenylacetate 2,3-dioxygenase n=1 Tax=Streptomyces sp. NPDC057474 TaxID=3346144 RepID=UPI0036B6B239
MLPVWNRTPAFTITRASHAVLAVADLGASRDFYRDVTGLVVTEETPDTIYLRGVEEAAHHSLVLRKSDSPGLCEQVGFRVTDDDEIEKAHRHLAELGIHATFVDVPYQGRTLRFVDPVGTHIELCASMETVPRQMQQFHTFRSAAPERFDHFQIVTYDVQAAVDFYSALGFRMSEYTATDGTDDMWGTWLEVKGNTHDLVFTNGRGPRMHHFGYTVPDVSALMHAADVAGSLGHGDQIDRGPGRHGISNAVFLYLRDPDGHRIELFTTHYQFIDLEAEPIRWDLSNMRRSQLWGMPASRRWFFEASEFPGEKVRDPLLKVTPTTLEDYLAIH